MVLKLLGYLLLIVGALGYIFFENYTGTMIPYTMVWLILFIALALTGAYLIAKAKYYERNNNK